MKEAQTKLMQMHERENNRMIRLLKLALKNNSFGDDKHAMVAFMKSLFEIQEPIIK